MINKLFKRVRRWLFGPTKYEVYGEIAEIPIVKEVLTNLAKALSETGYSFTVYAERHPTFLDTLNSMAVLSASK